MTCVPEVRASRGPNHPRDVKQRSTLQLCNPSYNKLSCTVCFNVFGFLSYRSSSIGLNQTINEPLLTAFTSLDHFWKVLIAAGKDEQKMLSPTYLDITIWPCQSRSNTIHLSILVCLRTTCLLSVQYGPPLTGATVTWSWCNGCLEVLNCS